MKARFSTIFILLQGMMSSAFATEQPLLEAREVNIIHYDNLDFKDLDKDGQLSPYEDWRLSPIERALDLTQRMNLEEKVGLMTYDILPSIEDPLGSGIEYDFNEANKMIIDNKVKTFITRLEALSTSFAEQNNALQEIAETSRLGIPLTISIEPSYFSVHPYKPEPEINTGFSQWPYPLGIAAIGSEKITLQYANIIRQELRAIGITQVFAPQADLATEPRWSQYNGTFGEDPELSKKMVNAYVIGMQNGDQGLNTKSVAAIVKHWVGDSATENGYNSQNFYGKYALFQEGDDDTLKTHIYPFTGAFSAQVAGIMPAYSVLKNASYNGKAIEPVGVGFNKFLLKNVLQNDYKFTGIIIGDWLMTENCDDLCEKGALEGTLPTVGGMPWGVEILPKSIRFIKAINAGIDQFGSVTDMSLIVQAVQEAKISESRIDESVLRILKQKFELGQFENPFVDTKNANNILTARKFDSIAKTAQRYSLVLLENKDNALPIKKKTKIFLHGLNQESAEKAGFIVVNHINDAEFAIVSLKAPYEQTHKNYFFGKNAHEGSLAFDKNSVEVNAIKEINKKIPVIATIYLDRPAILTPLKENVNILIANFGIDDDIFFTALRDNKRFTGKLPFEIPSSMEAVLKQRSDKPADSEEPLYPLGYGLY